jgi:hypothetical protein
MAVLVGLFVGFVAGYQRSVTVRLWWVLAIPLAVAVLEIAVNVDRFGVVAMALWVMILLGLTIGATAATLALGRRLRARGAS